MTETTWPVGQIGVAILQSTFDVSHETPASHAPLNRKACCAQLLPVNVLPSQPQYCVATGTLELRRVVGGKNAADAGLHDGAWKFTWSGNGTTCGTLQVATGT